MAPALASVEVVQVAAVAAEVALEQAVLAAWVLQVPDLLVADFLRLQAATVQLATPAGLVDLDWVVGDPLVYSFRLC